MTDHTPLCIVINGPSAAGKSTLAATVQDYSEEPLLRFGVDELYRMVPDQWAGGVSNARHAKRGFTYQDVPDMPEVRQIHNGADALAMLYAMNAAIIGILGSGVGVVVDGQAFEPSVNHDLEKRLRDLQGRGLARVAIIELAASDEQLADRQRRHDHPVGLSLYHNVLPKQAVQPDLIVDTSKKGADEVAELVCNWLGQRYFEHP
ncbi:phosphotransferase-like protein [Streptomyces silvensis]|uniref:Chloramphenicol phosphotransferase n=1 Tax=Streptomyces silvensis TaxID=1765722 RepID=A0A0W7X7H5_9ACTN|nr:chloramphenicol phosphotransferase [Streptomyces silvensis]KUF18650.1 chloramphenicol phosphotransferase [Streptomyces silvensis]